MYVVFSFKYRNRIVKSLKNYHTSLCDGSFERSSYSLFTEKKQFAFYPSVVPEVMTLQQTVFPPKIEKNKTFQTSLHRFYSAIPVFE